MCIHCIRTLNTFRTAKYYCGVIAVKANVFPRVAHTDMVNTGCRGVILVDKIK